MELEGKVAIVTGGTGNIGSACTRRLAEAGASVLVSDLASTPLADTVEQVTAEGGVAFAHEGDVGIEESVADMIATCLDRFGRIDAVVNVAAAIGLVSEDQDLTAMDASVWDEVMRVNARGPMLTTKHALPTLLAQGGGSIINFTSTAAFAGDHGLIAYSASKAAILGLTRGVATMYGRSGVRCNAIAPSGVWNDYIRSRIGPERLELFEQSPVLPRLGVPDDVAHTVVFLVSDKSSYITGQFLFVDGGGLAHQPWVRF